ncbi:MAG: cyclic nucleotide-binding domain-containing protein [Pseudomonadota bacterium]
MGFVDAIGWMAALFTLLTFCMRTMLPLRILAIASNLCFIAFATTLGLWQIVVLHGALLPLNLAQLVRLLRHRAAAPAAVVFEPAWIEPYAQREAISSGSIIFRAGDPAERLYYIERGEVLLLEIDKRLAPGNLLGEMGLFSPDRERLFTAVALRDTELLAVQETDFNHLCREHAGFAHFCLRLVTARLTENLRRAWAEKALATQGRA